MAIWIWERGAGIVKVWGAYFSPLTDRYLGWRVWLCNTYYGDIPVKQRWKGVFSHLVTVTEETSHIFTS